MLRKISLTLNAIVVILSLALFGYTFFARAHLIEHTRAFVTEKTLSYSKPLVELMRAGLDSPLSQKLISDEKRSLIVEELKLYDSDSTEYVTSLTSAGASSFGSGKLAKLKENIRNYYQSTLGALIRDFRIFSGSNIVAGTFAMWLLVTRRLKRNDKLIAFSFVIFAAVAFSTFSYIEGVSFLRILLKWHIGWWYPAGVAISILAFVFEYGLHKETSEEQGVDPNA